MSVGSSIFVTARVQPARHNPNRIDLYIGKVEFLGDIKDSLIESMTITMSLATIDEDTVLSLTELINESPGKVDLFFRIIDPEGRMNLTLKSRTHRITVKRDLVDFINNNSAMSYAINEE